MQLFFVYFLRITKPTSGFAPFLTLACKNIFCALVCNSFPTCILQAQQSGWAVLHRQTVPNMMTFRLFPWLTGLCLAVFTGFFTTPRPAAPTFPEPVVEGDTTVFQQLNSAWGRLMSQEQPEKCYAHTDRTLYAPGDTLWFNAFVVNAGDLRPSDKSQIVYATLLDPRGSTLRTLRLAAPGGVAAGEFVFEPHLPGGRYQLVVHTNWMCNDSTRFFKRDIVLQKAIAPRINLKMEFERKAVGPGDEVIARFDAATLENEPLAQQPLTFTVLLEGQSFTTGTAVTDGAGRARLTFRLPRDLATADGLLDVRIAHNGREASISRPIPIVLNKIDLQFFPEGGDAVAGLPCRMAFKAVNEFGKAADVAGFITDSEGNRVSEFNSFHNGMGSFAFTPQSGKQYIAHLNKPFAVQYPIPAARPEGCILNLQERNAHTLTFVAGSSRPGRFFLTGVSRDKVFFFKEIQIGQNASQITVPVADLPIGIARFTLLNAQKQEMAERLVFLHRDRSLKVTVEANQKSYQPREPVRLRLQVEDDSGRPVQGHFSVSVSDETLLTYADDKQGRLLASLLLEQDLKGEIEEPNFYFDRQEPKSEAALDYLLCTQGWRRFGWKQALLSAEPVAQRFQAEKIDGQTVLNSEITDDENTVLLDAVVVSAAPGKDNRVDRVRLRQPTDQVLAAEQIKDLPTKNVSAIVATRAPVQSEGVSIKGSRPSGTNYFIDGIRIYPQVVADEVVSADEIGGLSAAFESKEMKQEEDKMEVMGAPRSAVKPVISRSIAGKDVLSTITAPQQTFHRAREFYVPKYRRDQPLPAQRSDFRPTIYWNPAVTTDAFGEANLDFVTSDAITNFRITVEGISNFGQPGCAEHHLFTEKPVSIEVKIPHFVMSGDSLRLDALVVNKTDRTLRGELSAQVPPHFRLLHSGNQGKNLLYHIGTPASETPGDIVLKWQEKGETIDEMRIKITTLHQGYPVWQVFSGQSAQNRCQLQLIQPMEGSVAVTLTAYPGALEEVIKSTERMLQQPGGCFEQVSSSNYPNLLVLDLLRTTKRIDRQVEQQALEYLKSGYQQLTAYECKNGGFDWWGRDPAHEGLTAYGLLEFTDMQRVFPVDQTMIKRTMTWLLSRRDGQGGWKANPQSLHGWKNDHILAAYMAWAVAEAGYGNDFKQEIDHAADAAGKSGDPYQMALLTNALYAANDSRAGQFLQKLLELREKEGQWKGKTHSVLHASGPCFDVETSALGALALMKAKGHEAALARVMEFIAKSKNEYGYGSTQSTVLALKAITAYASATVSVPAEGQMTVMVDGRRVHEIPVSTKAVNRIEIPRLEQYFTNDHPVIEVFFEKGNAILPFDIAVQYASRQPRNTPQCTLDLQTSMVSSSVEKGGTVRLRSVLRNLGNAPAASPMLIVGIPAGLSLQPWQLKKLMDEKRCDFYEIWDGKAVFHFEKMSANATCTIDLDLRADVAGVFEAPASQAFLYYQNDQRVWSKPNRISVR